MESAGRDEQHVIRFHVAVLGLHRRAFDDRQQISLHPLARDIGPLGAVLSSLQLQQTREKS